jgi:hypothetical protein
MANRTAKIAVLILTPLSALAMPNGKASITFQVDKSTTRIHGASTNNSFSYTDLVFAQIAGKKLVYECVQRDDICPILEPGETYTADQEGHFLYLPMTGPELKKAATARFKLVGSW